MVGCAAATRPIPAHEVHAHEVHALEVHAHEVRTRPRAALHPDDAEPLRRGLRVTANPTPSRRPTSHFCNESPPRSFDTTSQAVAPDLEPGQPRQQDLVQFVLPTRIGGFSNQMVRKRRSAGTSSGSAIVTFDAPAAAALARASPITRSMTSTPHTWAVGGLQGHRDRDRAPAAADVEQGTVGSGCRHRTEQDLRAAVDAVGAEDPRRGRQGEGLTGERDVHLARPEFALGGAEK